jgi:hypothetical protein
MGRRLRQNLDTMVPQVLVRWSYLLEELCTWEDEVPLRQQFPRAPAWGQASSKGGGDVTAAIPFVPTPTTEAAKAPGTAEADDVEDILIEGAFDSKNESLNRRARSRWPNSRVSGP